MTDSDRLASPAFVHLRVHSEYSVVDGCVRVDALAAAALADCQPAVALTDLSNLFGLVKFYREARAAGVKPILGADVWVSNPVDRDKPTRLLLLIQDRSGYLRLCDWLSRAWLSNQWKGRAEVSAAWFDEGTDGLIALSGAQLGEIGVGLLAGNADAAAQAARRLAAQFPDRFYIEVQRADHPGTEHYIGQAVQLAAALALPVVATHPVQFLAPDDFQAHEARVCIAEGQILSDTRRVRRFTPAQHFMTQAQMQALFADLPAALANAVEIARRCSLELVLGKHSLPLFPTPEGMSLDDFMRAQAQAGLERRLSSLFPDPAVRETRLPDYAQRLEFECATIVKMGFSGYFLIVADFINWAKNNDVPVGPGRGSGAGSLVAYSLGITDLDPLRYNLLFERFLNPERVSMPDFDIDFCQDGRDRVIEYVRGKYGAESVSQIATFGTMAAKAAIRDVGRVLDMGYGYVDSIAKLIPFMPGKTVTIQPVPDKPSDKLIYARREEPQLEERARNEEEVAALLDLAARVEGLTRNVGMHAGGVLIAPGKLTDFCPLYTQNADAEAQSSGIVSQFDKDDVEAVGLVKFDFLGLTTLTILNWAVRYIRLRGGEWAQFELDKIPLDDTAAFDVLKSANTVAVFQLESRGMQDMLVKAKPDKFEDIIALVALYRPGPMDLIPSFCDRKHGKERVEYPDPRVEGILAETYGIMVYQEQVMQMAQIIGGYSLGGADLLRRAMGKKKPEEMAKHRLIFAEGAAKNGISEAKANEMFDLMEKFAGYGFNKSHAAAYALLAYHTAYLKAHFPAEFYAGNMSCALDDTDKIKVLWDDAVRRNGIAMLPPDINRSDYRFVPVASADGSVRAIRYGLGGIKGTGESAVMRILEERRTGGPFTSLFDFAKRVDRRLVNRRTMEALIRAGAFDGLTEDRAALMASIGLAIDYADQAEASANQSSLFGEDSPAAQAPPLAQAAAWTETQKLIEEKAVFGFSLSGHLFNPVREEVRTIARTPLSTLKPSRDPQVLAGVVTGVRITLGKRGRMAIVTIDDASASLEVMVFGDLFEQVRGMLQEDSVIIVSGIVRLDEFSGGLRFAADQVWSLPQARAQYARFIRIVLDADKADLSALSACAADTDIPASRVRIDLRVSGLHAPQASTGLLDLPPSFRVGTDDNSLRDVATRLRATHVELVYP